MILFCIILALSGALAGFLAGLFGIGGGIILVPALYYAAGIAAPGLIPPGLSVMHLAIGTSLAVILPTGASSAYAHFRREAIRFDVLAALAPGILPGAALGVALAGSIPAEGLKILFAFIITALAGLFLFLPSKDPRPESNPEKSARENFDKKRKRLSGSRKQGALAGLIIGGISVLAGIGGATLSVPYMRMRGIALPYAIGTASALGLLIALPGAAGFLTLGLMESGYEGGWVLGYIHLLALIAILPFSIIAAPFGASCAHRIAVRRLKPLFAGLMIVVALKMLYEGLGL